MTRTNAIEKSRMCERNVQTSSKDGIPIPSDWPTQDQYKVNSRVTFHGHKDIAKETKTWLSKVLSFDALTLPLGCIIKHFEAILSAIPLRLPLPILVSDAFDTDLAMRSLGDCALANSLL